MVWSQTDANAHVALKTKGLGIMFQGTEATLVADYNSYRIIAEKNRKGRRAVSKTYPQIRGRQSPSSR